jgi:hypothetical protein
MGKCRGGDYGRVHRAEARRKLKTVRSVVSADSHPPAAGPTPARLREAKPRGHNMTTNIPRASTNRANVLPFPPETTSPPAHSAPAVSRRTIMLRTATAFASAALVAAPSIAPATLVPTPSDPIFAAIAEARTARAEFFAWQSGEDLPDELGERYSRARTDLQRTVPTTPAGLAALTGFFR